MAGLTPTGPSGRITLAPAGPDTWRALDSAYPSTDARCLLAFVESVDGHYVVLSLVPPLGGTTEVETLSEAEAVVEKLRRSREHDDPGNTMT